MTRTVFKRSLIHIGVTILLRLVARLDVQGAHHLPKEGAFIIAANHLTRWDPQVMYLLRPRGSALVPLAAEQWRKVWLIRWVFESMGVVWVRRGEVDREALRGITQALKRGDPIGIAPEGTRSKTGQLQEGKSGVAWLARTTGVPVFPVAIWGVEQIQPNLKRLRRSNLHVRVGPAITVKPGSDLEASTHEIMLSIARMLPESYRGFYKSASV